MEIIVLAAGKGSKFFPYNITIAKPLRKVANIPIIVYNVDAVRQITKDTITVVANQDDVGDLRWMLKAYENIDFLPSDSNGTAMGTLYAMRASSADTFMVLYGDTIIGSEDIDTLYHAPAPAALVYPLTGEARDVIACAVEANHIGRIGGHDRGDTVSHRFGGFRLDASFCEILEYTPAHFPNVKVGVGVPCEPYLEAALIRYQEGVAICAIEGSSYFFDIDTPWELLECNAFMVKQRCGALTQNVVGEGSTISDCADICGFVMLGKNSHIGKNVKIGGNLIAGDNTIIDNGAILEGNCIVGSDCTIKNYCQIYDGCTVGNSCIVEHAAELLGGSMLMDKVYLYHYGEFYGAIGSYSDVGAGTVCGTLRFDDGQAVQRVNGHKSSSASSFLNATYLGDYVRTGVHTAFMPGVKVGSYSVVGPSVMVTQDLPHNTVVSIKQELEYGKWGHEQYGW